MLRKSSDEMRTSVLMFLEKFCLDLNRKPNDIIQITLEELK